ncbi:MAG: class I SAM-dependent methyltransferase [Clostridia bacterium]|nr:class I SAM-dependent methyltransferase [Clostridia bacterium]
MKPDYKNWLPKGMLFALYAGFCVCAFLLGLFAGIGAGTGKVWAYILFGVFALGTLVLCFVSVRMHRLYRAFSYDGKRRLSARIVEGVASYITLKEKGLCLDVGCGSGALAIAVAKKNPKGMVVGMDRWGKEYASYSKELCEQNAKAEGVANARFEKGDACALPYSDGSFDAVVSNYVYHNIMGKDRQELLMETLRVLKKGGSFAIHDQMNPVRYGDMNAFVQKLKTIGYEKVELIDTTPLFFQDEKEAKRLFLDHSFLLTGIK